MSAEFYTILPPPQTLETLDNWGSLDDLPLSLDSPAWETAGIYGLTIEDGAKASGSLEGSRQTAIPLSPAQAQSGAALAGALRIRTDTLAGSAKAGGGVTFQRIRNDSLLSGYAVSEFCLPLRIRQASMAGEVAATASASWHRVRLGAGSAQASGFARAAEWLRTRTDSVAAEGVTGGAATGYLIRSLQATGAAHTVQASAFERLRLGSGQATAQAVGRLNFVRFLHLVESSPAKSGESFTAARVRPHSATLHAVSGQSVAALRIRRETLATAAQGAANAVAQRIRTQSAHVAATSSDAAQWLRLRLDVLTATATLSGTLKATLLGNDRMYGYAYSGGAFEGQRTRTALVSGTAAMSGTASGVAIRGLVLRATATASGQLSAESGIQLKATATTRGSLLGVVLGFGWQGKMRPPDVEWGEKILPPEPWEGQRQNAAEWAQEGENKQGWNAEKAESGEWVKHGDEQGSLGIWSMGAGCGPVEWSASPGGEELRPGKAWIQAHEGRCSDGVPCAEWKGAGRGKPAGWRKPADVGGHGWGAVRP
jgi:hypothetical protein